MQMTTVTEEAVRKVSFLDPDYEMARKAIVKALFGEAREDLANQWREYNSTHRAE